MTIWLLFYSFAIVYFIYLNFNQIKLYLLGDNSSRLGNQQGRKTGLQEEQENGTQSTSSEKQSQSSATQSDFTKYENYFPEIQKNASKHQSKLPKIREKISVRYFFFFANKLGIHYKIYHSSMKCVFLKVISFLAEAFETSPLDQKMKHSLNHPKWLDPSGLFPVKMQLSLQYQKLHSCGLATYRGVVPIKWSLTH